MFRPPFIWLVICKEYSGGPSLNAILAELDKREANGTLSHRVVSVQEITLAVLDNQLRLFVNGVAEKKLPRVALIYLPSNPYRCTYLLPAIRHLEAMGTRCFNSSDALALGSDKFGQFQRLASHGIPMPDTASIVTPMETALPNLLNSQHGINFPAILKSNKGSKGTGVMLIPERLILEDIGPSLQDRVFLLQQYVKESHGTHVRVVVVAHQVKAFVKMTNVKSNRVQSNFHLGGVVQAIRDEEGLDRLGQLAEKIAKLLGLDFGALDFVKGPNEEWLFLEMNTCPGLFRYESALPDLFDYMISCIQSADHTDSLVHTNRDTNSPFGGGLNDSAPPVQEMVNGVIHTPE